jgi:hypothetical protein
MSQFAFGKPWKLVLLASLALGTSCAEDESPGPRAKKPTEQDPLGEWAFHVYVGDSGTEKRYDLRPVREVSFPASQQATLEAEAPNGAPKLKPNLVVDTPDGGHTLPDLTGTEPTAWALVHGAASHCGMRDYNGGISGQPPGPGFAISALVISQNPVVPPWNTMVTNGWSIFEHPPATCEESLAYSETLLCVANELAHVAEAVSPVKWTVATEYQNLIAPGTWTIPPQNQKDRFIARDLAIYVIATLALNDGWYDTIGAGAAQRPCSDEYMQAARDPSGYGMTNKNWIFDPAGVVSHFPPFGVVDATSIPGIVAGRLKALTQILRTSSRLLDELIDKSVEADLAGAARRRAHATDSDRGSEVAWGRRDNANGKYNTLAHAIRVIAGRWEMAPADGGYSPVTFYKIDPECSGHPAMDLIDGAYGEDLSARVFDRGLTTPGQEAALSALHSAGIIIPPTAAVANPSVVKSAIQNQLMETAALSNGIALGGSEYTAFTTSGQGKAIQYVMADIADGDLVFGLAKTFNQYRLLTGRDDGVTDVTTPGAGLTNATHVATSLSATGVQGTALATGIPTEELSIDIMSRMGRIQVASQCDEYGGAFGSGGGGAADSIRRVAFQDAYSIGQTLYRRLVALREEVQEGTTPPTAVADVGPMAEGASAEARAWTGPGRVFAASVPIEPEGALSAFVGESFVYLTGFEPSDFAVSDVADMPSEVVLVHGLPWVADCAARLRKNCPANFEDDYVLKPDLPGSSAAFGTATEKRSIGFDGALVLLHFENDGSLPNFQPQYLFNGDSEEQTYVVLRHDPIAPAKQGKVLGAVAFRFPQTQGGGTSFPVSRKQIKHFNEILGISSGSLDPQGIGLPGASIGPAYCIEGVPADLFVPLENELTSDSDEYENSWRHYLDLSRLAAEKADKLGQELIDIGLQQEFRREAAGEAVAEICGDFGAADQLVTQDGKVTAPPDDQNLKDCIAEEKYDVVFLTNDPTTAMTPANALSLVKEKLGCTTGSGSELCGVTSFSEIETLGLGLDEYHEEETVPPKCDGVLGIAESLKTGFLGHDLQELATADWLLPSDLKLLGTRLHLELKAKTATDPEIWILNLGGVARMSSAAQPSLWPGCRRAGQGDCTNVPAADMYDALFRRLSGSTQLGSGLDALGDPEIESAVILWRLQGALWTIGALGGTIPHDMFITQIPAANFTASWGSPARAALPTVFSNARFAENSGDYRLEAATGQNFAEDRELLGPGRAIDEFRWPPLISGEIPTWLSDIYLTPARYVHVGGVNPDLVGFGPDDPNNWISEQAGRLNNIICANPFGEPSGVTSEQTKARDATKALRGGGAWGKLCTTEGGTSLVSLHVDGSNDVYSGFQDLLYVAHHATAGFPNPFIWETLQKAIPAFPGPEPDPTVSSLQFWIQGAGFYDTAAQNSGFSNYMFPLSTCRHTRFLGDDPTPVGLGEKGLHFIDSTCTNDTYQNLGYSAVLGGSLCANQCQDSAVSYTRRVLTPHACSPSNRVQAFVNSYPPAGTCGAASQLAQAVTLACNFSLGAGLGTPTEKPQLKTIDDLDAFVFWIDHLTKQSELQVSNIVLEGIPKSVANDFAQLKVGASASKGEHGILLQDLRGNLEGISTGWSRIHGALGTLLGAVDNARNQIQGAQIGNESKLALLALQRLQIHADMVGTVTGLMGLGVFSGGVGAPAKLMFGEAMLNKTEYLEELAKEENGNLIAQALIQLQMIAGPAYTELSEGMSMVRASAATSLGIIEKIRFSEEKAKYKAAVAAGEDYFVDSDGQVVKIPLNTVQRRLYDITRLRYESALAEAKYLAYVARLAIEQRIGARLSTIKTKVGPLEEPYLWADDVCSVTGIDYKKLREFDVPDGGESDASIEAEKAIIKEFADQYIGDYVDKLANFVEYYNIQYPSHDGDDTTVLSLRDDLLGPPGSCVTDAPNLLYYSGDLAGHTIVTDAGQELFRGWELNACAPWDTRCLHVDQEGSFPGVPPLPETTTIGGITWLHDVEVPTADAGTGGDAGTDAEAGDPNSVPLAGETEPRTVSQSVELVAGSTYVLSWWDQGRDATGAYATVDSPAYRVAIVAPDGKQLESFSGVPYRPTGVSDPVQWSKRQSLEVKADASGKYRVVFAATKNGVDGGSVLIANVQIEQAPPGSLPGPYVHTTASREYISSACKSLTPEDVQKAFKYTCDKNKQCFYELAAPIVMDTGGLATGNSRLAGKLAAGNYNYRHISVAVNLVGTGVYDCTANPSQSCFASAYVDYSMDHDAFEVPVTPWDGIAQVFNFGSGHINHGKALAAERYITLPIGAADQSFLVQPGVEKPEYRGRPLDGSYRFRIWDSPFLVWNRVEDVQLVLTYRYWSKIDPQSGD